MALLEARGLVCGHDAPILRGIDLKVEAGETVVLLGPNGSGKSTLLNTLAGLLPPLGGGIFVDGEELRRMNVREVARKIASVPQDEPVPFAFTVRQLVGMGRLARSNGLLDTPEDVEATDDALAQADLRDLAERRIDRTSGGERGRALMARALAQDTPILLMDEPTAHLDVPHAVWTVRLVRQLAQEGRAVVVALHDLNLATAMGDRAVLLADGSIAERGPTETVLNSPALERTFGTEFERLRTQDGRLIVVPKFVPNDRSFGTWTA